jgi:pyruvate/2-oxoglutarate dehydrogenase complex dihydrolipoamide dehydrogenase (E3) component
MIQTFDAIVIGAGQAGPSLAGRLTAAGMSVALIERKLIGGTCVNTGCTPTKTLIASAYAARMARRASDYGLTIGGAVGVDMKKVKARKDAASGNSRTGLETWLKRLPNCTVYEGHARFETLHDVRVGDELLSADRIFLNVGGRALVPDMAGLDQVNFLTNTSMLDLDVSALRSSAQIFCDSGDREVVGSHVLLAVGRRPNTDDLGLDRAGIETDKLGYIMVDDQLRTNVPGVWALGDCNGKGAFTHTSYNDFEISRIGFRYEPELISAAEEQRLVHELKQLPFKPFEFQGFVGKRQVVSFAWRYDFNGGGRTDNILESLTLISCSEINSRFHAEVQKCVVAANRRGYRALLCQFPGAHLG